MFSIMMEFIDMMQEGSLSFKENEVL